ncbi:MarR family transcriptional regulator [Bacillus cereus]|uniref:MarR family transcriptional regulator n=1 Tax=Bacillus cereus TaxID=1396 RepID=A0A2B0MZB4_BACCE|nr:MarR family transcriptional regulator [Bacillus sp. TL12]EEL49549.1 Transcriptional regulator, MarR [Bacillus cereus Rock3-44]PFA24177.1 MarR family transcriptional regulator [Bacillus cereus]PFK46890.1 MarR family transcriptional regulator [Bacillus cereus]PFN09614.1 MarR family transcriptional regulator [Bacillus cereus]PFO81523.1 MarR family transcriptional regulator [Bacillus cereus]
MYKYDEKGSRLVNEKREALILDLSTSFRKMIRLLQNDINTRFSEHMPYNEFSVLRALFLKSPQMASQIASEVNVTSSHITAVTDRLVRKGFVTRKRSDSDRRIVYLEITEHGKEVTQKLEAVRKEYYKEKFKEWSDQEVEMVLELFGRVL